MPAPRPVIAVFRPEKAAAEAAGALRELGFDGGSLSRRELAPGRHLMEDEADPERTFRMRSELVLGGAVGMLVGVAIVVLALWGSATALALFAGALGGVLAGMVVGGVLASGEVPMDDDEDRWLTVTGTEHGYVVEAQVTGPIPLHMVHAVLRENGATAFLMPVAEPELAPSGSTHG